MEKYVLSMEQLNKKADQKFASMAFGGLFVMTRGIALMALFYAIHWDTMDQV